MIRCQKPPAFLGHRGVNIPVVPFKKLSKKGCRIKKKFDLKFGYSWVFT